MEPHQPREAEWDGVLEGDELNPVFKPVVERAFVRFQEAGQRAGFLPGDQDAGVEGNGYLGQRLGCCGHRSL